MKKYYVAKQISPEYQESPMFFSHDFENFYNWEDVSFFGNHDLKERQIPAMESFLHYIDDACLAYEELELIISQFDSIPEIVKYMFTDNANGYCVSDEVAKNPLWKRILEDWPNADRDEEKTLICLALEAMTGKEYDYTQISGCCQSDWQYIYYPADDYDFKAIEQLESEYFNTGEEWLIFEEPVEIEESEKENACEIAEEIDSFTYTTYVTAWNDEEKCKEIADEIGCNPDEVLLFFFDHYVKQPIYKLA